MAKYDIFSKNINGRDFIVGDIHGNYIELLALLKKVNFQFDKDRLFAVGDLTDRGAYNLKVISLLKENWFFSVRGNHEDIIMDIGLKNHSEYYKERTNRNGNEWYFKETDDVRLDILKAFKKLPIAIQVDKVGIVHAYPDNCWKNTLKAIKKNDHLKINTFFWNRTISKEVSNFKYNLVKEVKNIDYVVVGHQIQDDVQIVKNIVFLDTGCYKFNGKLSMIEIGSKKITSISRSEI